MGQNINLKRMGERQPASGRILKVFGLDIGVSAK
jgi:hypothetical protein